MDKIIFTSNLDKLELSSDISEYNLKLRIMDFDNDKEELKFIRNVESLVRMCPEYKLWTEFIRDSLDLIKCQVTGEFHNQARCDIHHYPISLFSMVKAIIYKHIKNQEEFCSHDIALECIQLHFKLKLGFCSLLKSIHEKFHAGYLKLPIDIVHGDYKYFLDNYGMYLDEDERSLIASRLTVTYDNCGWKSGEYEWVNYNTTENKEE